jgi:FdhD protein
MAQPGVQPITFTEFTHGEPRLVDDGVIDEALACISVNGQEIATMMCSPMQLDELALGFLRAEGFITSLADVRALHVASNNCVDVWLNHDIVKPERGIVTAGCGGGITFDDLSAQHTPLESQLRLAPKHICELMMRLTRNAAIYNKVRGIHTSALAGMNVSGAGLQDCDIQFIAEDVGRHNTIDRLWGRALRVGWDTADGILICSGRISSEMLSKAMKMRVPVIISRTSPTALSVALAKVWNLTVIGYCRGSTFRVYAGDHRIAD